MAYNRRSLKNLRPKWKQGESGNIDGRPRGSGFNQMLLRAVAEDNAALERGEIIGMYKVLQQAALSRETVVAKERVHCSVCRHDKRPVIDGLLTLGIPLRAIATGYGLSRSSVFRHKQRHTPSFPGSEQARQIVEAESILPTLLDAFKNLALCWSGSRFVELADASLDALWEAFEALLTDNPRDSLLIRMANAAFRLGVVHGHVYNGSDFDEAQEMLEALESWGETKSV
jgi:hypothetical protein